MQDLAIEYFHIVVILKSTIYHFTTKFMFFMTLHVLPELEEGSLLL